MAMQRDYDVKVTHPTGYHSGTHKLSVWDSTRPGFRYVVGGELGCSRDYAAAGDVYAIKLFLAEHACTVVNIKAC